MDNGPLGGELTAHMAPWLRSINLHVKFSVCAYEESQVSREVTGLINLKGNVLAWPTTRDPEKFITFFVFVSFVWGLTSIISGPYSMFKLSFADNVCGNQFHVF
ncbi:hypothetical protein DsansV1_C26g0191931 [Dioscorea sansibarensis]